MLSLQVKLRRIYSGSLRRVVFVIRGTYDTVYTVNLVQAMQNAKLLLNILRPQATIYHFFT